MSTDLKTLASSIKGEISTADNVRALHSRDASIFEVMPEAVIYPKDATDVQTIVRWAAAQKPTNSTLSLTARAAGTCMSGGSLTSSIQLDFTKYCNHILEIGADFGTAEPGTYYRDFENLTLAKGLLYPSYPASKALCAIGGIVNNNAGGEKTLRFGQTWKHVRSLDVVLADGSLITTKPLNRTELAAKMEQTDYEGEVYRKIFALVDSNFELLQKARPKVSKNSAGYLLWNVWDKNTFDLTKLFVGSQGTLGITTKATLGLIRPQTHSKLLVMFLYSLHNLGDIVTHTLQFNPETFESFDDHTFKLAIKFFPEMLSQMKGNLLKLAFQFIPEMWMVATGGIPKLILLAEFTGDNEQQVDERIRAAEKSIRSTFKIKTHITKTEVEASKYWIMRRESFNLLRHKIKDKHTAPFIDDVTVPVATLPQFLPRLNSILERYPSLIYTVAGHAGDANFHIIPLMNLSHPDERAIIPKLAEEVYDLVLEFQGSITAEHNDGIVRGPYLEKMFGKDVFAIFKQVKTILDPQGIFNPHKKTDASMEYLLSHIRKD
jgi:FAD/FMN-containing dehydrogenase